MRYSKGERCTIFLWFLHKIKSTILACREENFRDVLQIYMKIKFAKRHRCMLHLKKFETSFGSSSAPPFGHKKRKKLFRKCTWGGVFFWFSSCGSFISDRWAPCLSSGSNRMRIWSKHMFSLCFRTSECQSLANVQGCVLSRPSQWASFARPTVGCRFFFY